MILTTQEAADVLGYDSPDEMPGDVVNILLPGIDGFLKNATGKDWGAEEEIDPDAKMAARVLLRRWFDDPGMVGGAKDVGVLSLIGQLHAKALQEKQAVVT
jgi:hypothetical protein